MTTTSSSSASGFWAAVPRGVRLDEHSFVTRHRIISAVLLRHPPALAALGRVRGVGGWLLWGQIAIIVAALVVGQTARSHVNLERQPEMIPRYSRPEKVAIF